MFDAPGREFIDIGAGPVTPTARNGLQDQIEILRSTNLAEAVVEELRLTENPEFNPRLRPPVVTVMDRVREFVTVPEWARDSLRDLGIMEPPSTGGPRPIPQKWRRWNVGS
jgi:uncharacterized protein involved in exopolysaccharide biosynthesis